MTGLSQQQETPDPIQKCIWYDTCGWNPNNKPDDTIHFLNCNYTGPPKPADQESVSLVKEVCPHLYTEGQELNLCCSARQLRDIKESFKLPKALLESTCPTCYYNFRLNFCDMTCSPYQASFVRADHIIEGPGFDDYEGQNVGMVQDVTYFAHNTFVEATYNACKDVKFNAMNVMKILCGSWGEDYCNPYRWYQFLGDLSNGQSPFQINYKFSNETMVENHIAHNPAVVPCNLPAPGFDQGCSCYDCEDACADSMA